MSFFSGLKERAEQAAKEMQEAAEGAVDAAREKLDDSPPAAATEPAGEAGAEASVAVPATEGETAPGAPSAPVAAPPAAPPPVEKWTGPVLVVVGADNIGAATAQRFASEGYGVALLRRTPTKSKEVVDEINKTGQGRAIAIAADITNPTAVAEAFAEIKKELGKPNALVYNATALKKGSVASTSVEDFVECWQTNCLGAFLCAKTDTLQQALDSMGDGTMIFTGSADGLRGAGDTATLTVGKAGLRALAQSVARENKGIHVAHVILNGSVGGIAGGVGFLTSKLGVDTALTPSAVADEYWHLHTQNPSTWTFELDLRPRMEAFD